MQQEKVGGARQPAKSKQKSLEQYHRVCRVEEWHNIYQLHCSFYNAINDNKLKWNMHAQGHFSTLSNT